MKTNKQACKQTKKLNPITKHIVTVTRKTDFKLMILFTKIEVI